MPAARSSFPLVVATVALIVGVAVGYVFGSQTGKSTGYEQARQDIRARMDTGPASALSIRPNGVAIAVMNISGSITAIDGNTITLATTTVNADPTGNAYPTTRHITVTSATTIRIATQKDAAVFAKEMQEFFAKSATAPKPGATVTPVVPPTTTTIVDAKLADLAVGMTINASADKDVATAASFDAATITVNVVSGTAPAAAPTTK